MWRQRFGRPSACQPFGRGRSWLAIAPELASCPAPGPACPASNSDQWRSAPGLSSSPAGRSGLVSRPLWSSLLWSALVCSCLLWSALVRSGFARSSLVCSAMLRSVLSCSALLCSALLCSARTPGRAGQIGIGVVRSGLVCFGRLVSEVVCLSGPVCFLLAGLIGILDCLSPRSSAAPLAASVSRLSLCRSGTLPLCVSASL
jgi:hypothetical protein